MERVIQYKTHDDILHLTREDALEHLNKLESDIFGNAAYEARIAAQDVRTNGGSIVDETVAIYEVLVKHFNIPAIMKIQAIHHDQVFVDPRFGVTLTPLGY
jgi:hypothetical protein